MIKLNEQIIEQNHFPDGTPLLKVLSKYSYNFSNVIRWHYESNEELITLIFLVKHLHGLGINKIDLSMPYLPNARQDRIKNPEDVFTLKYFAEVINSLNFRNVQMMDVHSNVGVALINCGISCFPYLPIRAAKSKCKPDMVFFPDEGAMKRYSAEVKMPYAFGIKNRDWETGEIKSLEVHGEDVKDKKILIIDDICSRGGTFYHSAKRLKELGAKEIYLYITHCENTILEGELLTSGLIEKVYTTNSIFTKEHEKIEVFEI